jgi:hypothetical protein
LNKFRKALDVLTVRAYVTFERVQNFVIEFAIEGEQP